MTDHLAETGARLLAAARAAGADAADAVVVEGRDVSVTVRRGALEEAVSAERLDLGLRVLVRQGDGWGMAQVSGSDAAPATLARLAERAVAIAREAPPDLYAGLAEADQLGPVTDDAALDRMDDAPDPTPAELEAAARAAEEAAAAIPGVTQVEEAGAGHGRTRSHICATNGLAVTGGRSGTSLSVGAIAGTGTGMERDWDYDSRTHRADLRPAADIGARAGARAVERLGAVKPPTGAVPVLYDRRVASSLIGHLVEAINGAAIARGSSFLRDRLGEAVLPAHLSLLEEPHRRRQAGSRLWDGEGLPTRDRALVEDGRLTTWLLTLAAARQLGLAPTGHAVRGTSGNPSPGASNLRLTPGDATRDDLIASMGRGLLVTSLIGSTINPTTGDYSRGASGFWIEDGRISHPVTEATIAGNLREMLARIEPADDAETHLSRVVPSILIREGMTVAGA